MTTDVASAATPGTIERLGSPWSRVGWWVITVLSVAMALYSWRFLVVAPESLYPSAAAGEVAAGDPSDHFFWLLQEHWLRFAAHFVFGPLALLVGPFQFSDRLRRRLPRLHRRAGWLYAVSIAVSGLAGLRLAADSFGGLTTHIGFGLLAILWLGSTGAAVWHARHRRFEVHRQWMMRSFALTFGAVTLRFWIPFFMVQGVPFEEVYQTVAWLAWVPNLLVAEALIARRRAGRRVATV